jgi:hypothetical protein
MKTKEMIFALVRESAGRARKPLETLELYSARFSGSAEVTEKMAVGTLALAKECAIQ